MRPATPPVTTTVGISCRFQRRCNTYRLVISDGLASPGGMGCRHERGSAAEVERVGAGRGKYTTGTRSAAAGISAARRRFWVMELA